MFSKPLLLVSLAGACLAAAGGGMFLASYRVTPGSGPGSPATTGLPSPEIQQPLAESEVVIEATDEVAQSAPAAVPEPPASQPARRAEPKASPTDTARRPEAGRPPDTPRASSGNPPPVEPGQEPDAGVSAEWTGLEEPWPSRPAEPALPQTPSVTYGGSIPALPPMPPEPMFEELVLPADLVIGLQVERGVSTDTARVEDRVDARVIRDVRVGTDVAIPAGARAVGAVTLVEPGGKIKERARLGIRFHTVVLADGTEIRLRTETIYREGDSPAAESSAKIGGAALGGAILGAILGGKRGAVLGGAAGAAGGTAATMAGGRNPAELPAGTEVTIRLSDPATVTIER